ncbi:MAG TPA: hypothetical protein VN765_14270, partial [Candidatus Acidoferrum sp.]|nr:hypothetical protein [Candidatus Acidoferrum sp.]
YLLDEIRLHGENGELRDEVTQLARKYGIVTPYTAYLIVEDEARRGLAVNLRSYQNMDKDMVVQLEAAKSWRSLNSTVDGAGAIAGAQMNDSMKNASALPPSSMSGAFAGGFGGRGGGGAAGFSRQALGLPDAPSAAAKSPSAQAREQLVQYSQQSQFVNGRNFFQNGSQWTDSEVQNNQAAKHTRIQFNSADYFSFVAKNKQALPWLALGQNVQFVLDGVVYEIYE